MRTEETITNEMMTNDKFYEEIDDLLDRQSGLVIDDLLKYNIIHLCLNIHHENVLPSDIIKYLQINK